MSHYLPLAGILIVVLGFWLKLNPMLVVTVAALALPSAMAYGELAGLSPVNGLYTLLLPTVAYVLFGSSRRLVIGPEGATSTLVAAAATA